MVAMAAVNTATSTHGKPCCDLRHIFNPWQGERYCLPPMQKGLKLRARWRATEANVL